MYPWGNANVMKIYESSGGQMGWVEIFGYVASGVVFVTFWMKTLIALRIVAILGNVLYFGYGLNADLFNIVLLHGALLPLNGLRLYQSIQLRNKIHRMAHAKYDVRSLLAFMSDKTIAAGEFLFRSGDDACDIFYLAEGRAHIVELGIDIEPGQLVGEIAMFAPDKRRTQSVKCLEDCTFMKITEEKALQIYADNPEFGLYLTKMIVDRLLSNAAQGRSLSAA